ncbi:MAG TPA: MFS transporter [Nevskiaceae bacterium]|nr:MFS transporter [Nevskiaceae bacterium]
MQNLPRGVVALGFVSLFMDASSESIHSLLPLFLTGVLGASALEVGLISGFAEATVSFTKLFSGVVSDWIGRRKPLVLIGYGLAAATKPFFPLAHSVSTVFIAHVIDRFGKGIRGAPRDALVADITPPEQRGAAYGLRQGMDTAGAFIGPLAALLLLAASHNDIRYVFSWALLPALLAVLTIVLFIREPERKAADGKRGFPIRREALRRLPRAYWQVVLVAALLTLARISESFLILRGQDAGLPLAWTPLVLIAMNASYALSSYPLGALADRMPRARLLMLGVVLLIAAQLLLAAGGLATAFAGIVVWGLHMGATQGLLSALVADSAPADLRGSAFGMFNLVTGTSALVAGTTAGIAWTAAGPVAPFLLGAAFSMVTLVLLGAVSRR